VNVTPVVYPPNTTLSGAGWQNAVATEEAIFSIATKTKLQELLSVADLSDISLVLVECNNGGEGDVADAWVSVGDEEDAPSGVVSSLDWLLSHLHSSKTALSEVVESCLDRVQKTPTM
jgi:hypothetical protein